MYHLAKSIYLYATSKEEYSILLLGLDNAGKTTLLSAIKHLYLDDSSSSGGINARTVPTVGQNVQTISLPDMYLKIWDVGGQHSLRRLWQSYYRSCHAIVFVIDSSDVGDRDMVFLAEGARRGGGGQEQGGSGGGSGGGSESGSGNAGSAAPGGARMPGEGSARWSADANGDGDGDVGNAARTRHEGRLEECRLVLESVLASSDAHGVPVLVLANKQDREDCVETVRIKEGLVRPVFEGERGGGVRDSRVLPCSALTGTGVREAVEWVRSRVKWNREGRPPVMR